MNFQAFVDDIQANRWQIYGVEVYQGGQLVHQYGDVTTNRHPIYSATKTITSIAAGMAMDEGRLDLHQSILTYLPETIIASLPPEQLSAYRHITLQRLMTMSVAGYPFRPEGESWLDMSLHHPLPHPERKEFHYSNIPAYLIGVAIAHAVDEPLYAYLCRKLFTPLGIAEPPFTACPEGYFYGASGMELTVHELSQIGLTLYHGGVYQGQRIVSEAYVKEATSIQQMNREGGYGYFTWKYRDGFSINGKWGQKCYILPQDKLMVTFLSCLEQGSNSVKASMERCLIDV